MCAPGRSALGSRTPDAKDHGSRIDPRVTRRAAAPARREGRLADNILWVLLGLALLVYFVQDPKQTLDDVKTGLSNGTIWALIALGYTLVYGIIELINFAHGEVFMIGSFVAVSIWQTLGVTRDTSVGRDHRLDRSAVLVAGDARLGDAQRDDRARGLQAAAQRAQAGAADHRDRHELHPAERRPAVAAAARQRRRT